MARKKIQSVRWILASSSPRRIDLLRTVGIEAEVHKPDVDETVRRGETPASMVRRLSLEKARAIADPWTLKNSETHVFIAADTTVVAPGGKTVLGKPTTEKEARAMLRRIAGREHLVLTGYTILARATGRPIRAITRVVRTRVQMRKLTDSEIAAYIRSGEPMDKAGAYGAQGLGMALIESIRGSYTNVVGLPIAELLADLRTWRLR